MLRMASTGASAAAARSPERLAGSIAVSLDHLLWVVGSLCHLAQRAFDAVLTAQQHPPPLTVSDIERALTAAGFKCTLTQVDARSIHTLPLPFVGFLKAASNDTDDDPGDLRRPALILRVDRDRLLVCPAGQQTPEIVALEGFAERLEPYGLVARHVPADPTDATENVFGSRPAFGFRWFWDEAIRHRPVWTEVILASVVITLLGLAVPLATQVILDKVVVHQTYSTLAVVASALGAIVVFTAVMTWVRQYLVNHTGTRVDAVLSSRVFSHLLRLPIRYFDNRPTGTIVARLQGVETIREFITGAAVTLILDLPMIVIFLAFMFAYSWQLSLIAVGALAIIAVLSLAITPALRRRLDTEFLLGARNQAFLTEYVRGVETVKSLTMEARTEQRYGEYLSSHLAASFSTRQLGNTYGVTSNAIEQAMTLGILCVGAMFVMRSDGFTIGMLVAFQMFASRLAQPLLRMVGLWQQFQQADIAVKRLGDLMDAPIEPYAKAPRRTPGGKGQIEIQGLSFRYSERHPWLYRDLSVSIPAGMITVIRGPSGSGKSTLGKLLLGMHVPADGRILIDGKNLSTLGVNEVRQMFGVVPQETLLFSNTLYDNLIDAAPHASFQDVVQACRLAEIHTFIEQLPEGYETVVGEQGSGLSGGQRQRMAIARALLRAPKILLFDEATSHLDGETAEAFARTVNRLRGGHTIVFIAHHVPKALIVDREVLVSGVQ